MLFCCCCRHSVPGGELFGAGGADRAPTDVSCANRPLRTNERAKQKKKEELLRPLAFAQTLTPFHAGGSNSSNEHDLVHNASTQAPSASQRIPRSSPKGPWCMSCFSFCLFCVGLPPIFISTTTRQFAVLSDARKKGTNVTRTRRCGVVLPAVPFQVLRQQVGRCRLSRTCDPYCSASWRAPAPSPCWTLAILTFYFLMKEVLVCVLSDCWQCIQVMNNNGYQIVLHTKNSPLNDFLPWFRPPPPKWVGAGFNGKRMHKGSFTGRSHAMPTFAAPRKFAFFLFRRQAVGLPHTAVQHKNLVSFSQAL